MKKISLFLLSFLLTSNAFAGQMVKIQNEVQGYLAKPASQSAQPGPAILLIHEWWGLNDYIKGLADQFAENGYTALAVDLYRGHATADPAEAHELMRGLPDDRAAKDLKAALDYLAARDQTDLKKMAAIGWCMGGGFSLQLGTLDPRVSAVVMYYGKLITDPARLNDLKAPLLGIFGAKDRGISPESVREFESQLRELHKRAEIHIYPEAGHAFANPNNKDYRKDDADDAWKKTMIFLTQNLA